MKKIDLHMHTTISDGTDTLEELLKKLKKTNIELFSVTDHDAIRGGLEMPDLLDEDSPAFIRGIEFSCKDEDGKCHILGYGYDPDKTGIHEVVEKGHAARMRKTRGRLRFIQEEFGFQFEDEEIRELLALDNPGKPHIANLMVKHGYAGSRTEAIKDYIDRKRFPSEYITPREAIEGILASDGIPVLAHPTYGSGDDLILGDEMEERIRKLMSYGLAGLEAYYSGFTDKIEEENLRFAEKYDLYVTAGSDYHGGNKLIALGDNNLDNAEAGPEGMQRFFKDVEILGGQG